MGAHRTESCKDSTEDDLTEHEEPTECAEDLVLDEVFAALEDDVFVEAVWEPFGRPVPSNMLAVIINLGGWPVEHSTSMWDEQRHVFRPL